jgi:hypothetical protein
MTTPTATNQLEPLAYSVREFCQICRTSRTSFYADVATGRIKVLKRRRRTFVLASEAKRYLRELQRETDAANAPPKGANRTGRPRGKPSKSGISEASPTAACNPSPISG